MKKRVLLAGLFHETHTFLDERTSLKHFAVLHGKELLTATDDSSPLSGVIETGRKKDWDIMPVIDMHAMPGGIVEDSVVELFWNALRSSAEHTISNGIDGIYLILHGAMVSESLMDVEGEILERIHSVHGSDKIPVCGVIDPHANVTQKMAQYSHGLIAYRENPHTDAKSAAIDAVYLLDQLMKTGKQPITVWEHPPLMWPPTGTSTASNPMKSLEKRAREIETSYKDILTVNVCAGFAFADIPETGASFTAVTLGDPDQARKELRGLSERAMELKESGNVIDTPIEEVMQKVKQHEKGPILIVEPSDNIGGGAPGDSTAVLQALIEHDIKKATVMINDPEAVSKAVTKEKSDTFQIMIGGKGNSLSPPPLSLDVELVSTSNGRFTLEDPCSHLASMCGTHIDMGPCAVVRHKGIIILLTSKKTPPFDLGQLRSQGIKPEEQFVIGVKAAVAHKRAYDPIAKASYTVDTPGPCSSNLKRFPFKNVKRPVFPLDEI